MKCLACGNKLYCFNYGPSRFCHLERYKERLDFCCKFKDIHFDFLYGWYMFDKILDDMKKLMTEGVKIS